jgi:hypothetical protein
MIALVPLRFTVGAVDTTNVVALVTELTVVLAANAPVPEYTNTVCPATSPVVDATVIVVPEDVAPEEDVYTIGPLIRNPVPLIS